MLGGVADGVEGGEAGGVEEDELGGVEDCGVVGLLALGHPVSIKQAAATPSSFASGR